MTHNESCRGRSFFFVFTPLPKTDSLFRFSRSRNFRGALQVQSRKIVDRSSSLQRSVIYNEIVEGEVFSWRLSIRGYDLQHLFLTQPYK